MDRKKPGWIVLFLKIGLRKKFVPRVKHYLRIKGLPVKVLLLMDNAPAHPSTEELCSRDGLIKTMFLPANTTSLIQPMDQGVLYNLKRRYKRNLLEKMILYETTDGLPYDQFAKSLTSKIVFTLLPMHGSKSRVARYRRHGISCWEHKFPALMEVEIESQYV